MISREHQFIFIHVPKTGGTSIEKALELGGPRHNTARQYKELFPELWESYYSFAFVRNPWDRVLSLYLYRQQIRKLETARSTGFKEWLVERASLATECDHEALNREFAPEYLVGTSVRHDPEGWRVKFDSAFRMLADQDGQLAVDFIGRFERLQSDFDQVCGKLGIPRRMLPHCNKTLRRPYWFYYDAESRRIVEELFRKDVEHFGYEFGK